ncbi:unnamed protein product [Rotaria sp. Silwood1]|nr:unnamed protein product [Rotaria sp. Silwood1]
MKANMACSCVELNDLPDEIFLIIFKKLDNFDILNSFHGVKNIRLNKIIHDSIFTSDLNFVKWSSNKFFNKLSSNVMLNRFCLQILPAISIKIKWLYLESSSAENILRAADYPSLYGLGLYNIKEKTARRLFNDQSFSNGIFKKQITKLIITTQRDKNYWFTIEKIPNLKCFVLSCASEISRYKELLLPLIYRMSNVEKLGLYLTLYLNDKFIDGNYLKKNIINHLPQLNAFTFDIHSLMFINN